MDEKDNRFPESPWLAIDSLRSDVNAIKIAAAGDQMMLRTLVNDVSEMKATLSSINDAMQQQKGAAMLGRWLSLLAGGSIGAAITAWSQHWGGKP